MSSTITNAIIFFLVTYLVILVVDLVSSRAILRFVSQLALSIAFVLFLRITFGFPSYGQSFGGIPPVLAILVILISTVAGVVAEYFFFLKGRFTWRAFVKPICVTPILLLPLVVTMQPASNLESIQVIILALVSFQSGFFWKTVIPDGESKT
jgi:hypothetical protein